VAVGEWVALRVVVGGGGVCVGVGEGLAVGVSVGKAATVSVGKAAAAVAVGVKAGAGWLVAVCASGEGSVAVGQ
jgi:hypothetical protein